MRVYLETTRVRPIFRSPEGTHTPRIFSAPDSHHFTFGENFRSARLFAPVGPFTYYPNTEPVILDWWKVNRQTGAAATSQCADLHDTVPGVRQTTSEWNGENLPMEERKSSSWRFIHLPQHSDEDFELALACEDSAALQPAPALTVGR